MMDSENSSLKRHPIQVVARRTGLTVDVLRVWEKRYGVVEPTRSPGGHRLYSDDDVERLNLLRSATEAGRRISKVADLTLSDLRSLVREDADAAVNRHRVSRESLSPAPEEHFSACLEAVDGVDGRRLETTLTRASVALAAPVLIEQVLAPLMAAIGERWEHGRLSPGQEHLASSVIRRVLESLTRSVNAGPEAPGLVVATPTGQVHEFGALFVAAAAATQGWRVEYLGTDLPAADIAEVARLTGASAIALSIVYPSDDPRVADELVALRAASGHAMPILAGGRAAAAYEEALEAADVRLVNSLHDLHAALNVAARTLAPVLREG